mmetsp:Transcript_23179/g.54809  ORF Transcript_23179/g.54809 Transcript_23179/m.54809 type:complete len:609 (+) Transcript_23179:119-1945(+)
MDFRSQLSAFQKKNSGNPDTRSRDLNRGRGRESSNDHGNSRGYDGTNNYYNSNHHNSPNQGSSHHASSYGRSRPRERNHTGNYHRGPPTTRRRFHSPRHGPPGQHGLPDLDGLGEMRNLGYHIPRGFPPDLTKEEKSKKPKHLALLAISIDDLPYENIWKGWCETLTSSMANGDIEVDEYFISLVCHAKFPEKVESEWLRQRLLTFPPKQGRGNSFMDPVYLSRKPEWGSVEITRAMLDLLQDGLKIGNDLHNNTKYEDKRFCASRYLVRSPPSFNTAEWTTSKIPPVDQFLFISESCIPVVTAPEFFFKITNSNVSWLNARHRAEDDTPKNKYEDDQFAGINRRIPGQYRWKGDQWVLLSKRHASSIIGMDRPFKPPKYQLWQSFRNINASDEMFFPTALALLGDLRYTKDGHDTQKGRNRSEESFHEGNITSNASGKSGTINETDSATNPSTATKPSSSPKNQSILLKPVTYTDWTEGMRNPRTFSNGPADLRCVCKLARGMGCLAARKFVTSLKIPGIPSEHAKPTGLISVEEWESIIKDVQREETTVALTKSEKLNSGKDDAKDIDDVKKLEPLEIHGEGQESNNSAEDTYDEDNDNDDDENQL